MNASHIVRYLAAAIIVCYVFGAPAARAQGSCTSGSINLSVICAVPQVYGPNGLSNGGALASVGSHAGHFANDFAASLAPLNSAVASQLSFLPVASPSSGFSFTFDKSLGTFVASNDGYGPILSERARTTGRHRLTVGVSFEYFDFSSIDGIRLKNIPATYLHQPDCQDSPAPCPAGTPNPPPSGGSPNYVTCSVNYVNNVATTSSTGPLRNKGACGFVRDYIQTQNDIGLTLSQTTIAASFGLTSRIDVSMAIPIVDVHMNVTSAATIVPNSMSGDHVFPNPSAAGCTTSTPPAGSTCYSETFSDSRSSTGIGDITLRVKGTIINGERNGVAAGIDVRTPTGNAMNFLGSGTTGVRLFGVWSYSSRITPHVNLGYEWNGTSVLAGDVFTGTSARLPNELFYSAGADAAVVRRLTAAFDLVGQRILSGQQLTAAQVSVLGACDTPVPGCANPAPSSNQPSVVGQTGSYNLINALAGVRINPFKSLLVSGSVLFKLDNGGLRANYVPVLSASYSFK